MNGTLRWLGQCVLYSGVAYIYNRHGTLLVGRRLAPVLSVGVAAALTGSPALMGALAAMMSAFYLDGWLAVLPALWRHRPWGVRAR